MGESRLNVPQVAHIQFKGYGWADERTIMVNKRCMETKYYLGSEHRLGMTKLEERERKKAHPGRYWPRELFWIL
ncbi:hypothetical protein RRG08_058162 [Elysia crispata]|uniref:Uncharacterized protein n=1 Tax=Elysia crispata TaxID=231223 RepID=A0AAE0Y1N2_9GAST|nr:hypothetical protein RRG08_058162 [Elysia crispata]